MPEARGSSSNHKSGLARTAPARTVLYICPRESVCILVLPKPRIPSCSISVMVRFSKSSPQISWSAQTIPICWMTVCPAKKGGKSGINAIRRRNASSRRSNNLPSTKIVPLVGTSSPAIIWINVVLPAPLFPIRAIISPGWHSKDTSRRASCFPNRRPRFSTLICTNLNMSTLPTQTSHNNNPPFPHETTTAIQQ